MTPRLQPTRTPSTLAAAGSTSAAAGRTGEPGAGRAKTPKPLRFKIGVALLVLYPFLYLAIPIAPFLPLDGGMQVAFAGGTVAVAEVLLIVAVALMGKEAYQGIKVAVKRVLSRRTQK